MIFKKDRVSFESRLSLKMDNSYNIRFNQSLKLLYGMRMRDQINHKLERWIYREVQNRLKPSFNAEHLFLRNSCSMPRFKFFQLQEEYPLFQQINDFIRAGLDMPARQRRAFNVVQAIYDAEWFGRLEMPRQLCADSTEMLTSFLQIGVQRPLPLYRHNTCQLLRGEVRRVTRASRNKFTVQVLFCIGIILLVVALASAALYPIFLGIGVYLLACLLAGIGQQLFKYRMSYNRQDRNVCGFVTYTLSNAKQSIFSFFPCCRRITRIEDTNDTIEFQPLLSHH